MGENAVGVVIVTRLSRRVNQVVGSGVNLKAGGPVFVSPPYLCWSAALVLLIVTALAPASITSAGRSDRWKPLQQLLSAGSSRL